MITLRTILVPTDFSECSEEALQYGLELARRFAASLHLLHVAHDPVAQPWAADGFSVPLFEVVEQWQKQAQERLNAAVPQADRGRVTIASVVGTPFAEILAYAAAHE